VPSKQQLDNIAQTLGLGPSFDRILSTEAKLKVFELTTAACQAKALTDIAYCMAFATPGVAKNAKPSNSS